MLLASLVLASFAGLQAQESWDALAKEYEQAFSHWGAEMSRSGGWDKPESERPASPAIALWPRFETLSAAGEGRATVWMLQNLPEDAEKRATAVRTLFERVRAGGEAPWVARALGELVNKDRRPDDASLCAYVTALTRTAKSTDVRVQLLRLRAALAADTTAGKELELHAAFLKWKGVELGDEESLERESQDELAGLLLKGVEASGWLEANMVEGEDGIYYPRAVCDVEAKTVWRGALDTLAERGSARACVWVLTNTYPREEAERVKCRGYLDAIAKADLDPADRAKLPWYVKDWMQALGTDFVEPPARSLAAKSTDKDAAQMLVGLGQGFCELGQDDAAREKGLALLREVQTRWPTSEQAKSATGKLFRYTNLVVGKPVPDFGAVDVDGNAFKLSDYSGKVTVVDFWGFW